MKTINKASKNKIIEFSKKINIHKIGFTKAYYDYFKLSEYNYRKENNLLCELEINDNLVEMLEPSYWLENAKSIIVILEGYKLVDTFEFNKNKDALEGIISGASVYKDYHKIVRDKLDKLKLFIEKEYKCNCRSICDSNTFSDRNLALSAGLGEIGKNSFLINEELGSSTYIGYLITDIEIDSYDNYKTNNICSNCNLCVEICPNNAIIGNNQINPNRCVSFLTQAKRLSEKDKPLIYNSLYGCDICQLVCPYNRINAQSFNGYQNTSEQIIPVAVSINELISISNKEFKSTFGASSAGWIGKKRMQRNAIITLGNIASSNAKKLLKDILNNNPDEDVKNEVISSLNRIETNEKD